MKITSNFTAGSFVDPATRDDVKNEPMLFSCDLKHSYFLGSTLTYTFLNKLPQSWRDDPTLIVDSRVHMLMPNWYPCIPGYHHDDVPRSRKDRQPNYDSPEYKSEHCMLLLGDNICPTEFAVGTCEMPEVPQGQIVYKEWHKEVLKQIAEGNLKRVSSVMNQMLFFDWQTFHQGVASSGSGWRFFIRASRNTQRVHSNELRRQVQVYMDNPMEGW